MDLPSLDFAGVPRRKPVHRRHLPLRINEELQATQQPEPKMSPDVWQHMPLDMVEHMAEFLPMQDVHRMALVSKEHQALASRIITKRAKAMYAIIDKFMLLHDDIIAAQQTDIAPGEEQYYMLEVTLANEAVATFSIATAAFPNWMGLLQVTRREGRRMEHIPYTKKAIVDILESIVMVGHTPIIKIALKTSTGLDPPSILHIAQ